MDRLRLRRTGILVALAVVAWGGTLPAMADEDSPYRVVRPDDIYLGSGNQCHRPALLELALVFEHIAPYQEIADRGLTEADGEYWILLEKANRVFVQVLERLAQKHGYDIIGENGAVVAEGDAPTPPLVSDEASQLAEAFGDGSGT